MTNKFFDFNTEDYDRLKTGQLKRMADYWLRQYLLKNAKRNSFNKIWCPIKQKYFNENQIEASHFIDRSNMSTRYNTDNVWLISKQSNTWDAQVTIDGYKSLHHKEFEEMLKNKIGQEKFDNLLANKNNLTIFARQDYVDVIKKFRNG